MRKLLSGTTLIVVVLLIHPAAGAASDEFIKGSWSITYLVRDPQKVLIVPAVKSSGFIQTSVPIHRGYQITVTSALDPLAIQGCPGWHRPSPGDTPALPDTLTDMLGNITSMTEIARLVMDYVDTTTIYALEEQDQSWQEVMRRGTGNCEGRVNLAVEILGRLGISSRSVLGCLFENNDALFHSWIEIEYPGIGALPSDPGRSQDFVDPMHLVLYPSASSQVEPDSLKDLGVEIEIVTEKRDVMVFDFRQSGRMTEKQIQRRKLESGRYSGVIAGRVPVPVNGDSYVDLTLNGKRQRSAIDPFGRFAFTGLDSGEYSVVWHEGMKRTMEKSGTLYTRQFIEIPFQSGQVPK